MHTLQLQNKTVQIDAGELTSYQVNGHEYIHQKGSPGWRSSDTEMFPIIGPTAEARFQVQTPKDIAIQDQHGLLREMDYEVIAQGDTEITFRKTYVARTQIPNSKYPEKSKKQFLFWPYDFQFEKRFSLSASGLEISFEVSGERDSPFMLGYHPAFKLHSEHPTVLAGEKTISLDAILAVGSRALEVPDCTEIVLKDENELRIETEGFKSFMLWTEVQNMVCIEPITFYPYAVAQQRLHEGFEYLLDSPKKFKITLIP